MANARVRRGRKTAKIVAEYLRGIGWPKAFAVEGFTPGRDILHVPGHAIEVKARSEFDPRTWWRQAKDNAGNDRPCVIVRMNGQGEDASEYLVFRILRDDELSRRGA
jgi:hypothetical protein